MTRLQVLEQNWDKFHTDHESICQESRESLKDQPYIKTKMYERCQAFYVHARASLLSQRDDLDSRPPTSSTLFTTPIASMSSHRVALPRITMPQFSGEYKYWVPYRDLFSSLIGNNPDLSNVEKMHYLKTSLSDQAALLISNLSISGENFTIAWDALVMRYENKRFLIAAQLDKLSNLKPLKPRSARGLNLFLATINEALGALRALGCPIHYWNDLLLHQIIKLLDPSTREAWEIKLGPTTISPIFAQFEEFLTGRARALENLELHAPNTISVRERSNYSNARIFIPVRTNLATSNGSKKDKACILCKRSHFLISCPTFQAKSTQQHYDFVVSQRLCFNCLGAHSVINCRSSLIHHVEQEIETRMPVLLATCQAMISTRDGDSYPVRILLDQGSELSFVAEDLVTRLNLPQSKATISLLGIARIPSFETERKEWQHLQGLQLADPDFLRPGPIKIIIGADFYGQIIQSELIKGQPGSPIAQASIFGWTVSRPVSSIAENKSFCSFHCTKDEELINLLQRFWKQEETTNTTSIALSPDEERCEAHFVKSHSRDNSGRYIVHLPFKKSADTLGDSSIVALRSLNRLFKRFETDLTFRQRYSDFVSEYKSLGHMIPVPESKINSSPVFYLPHHGVLREQSCITKLRVVFNGSSKSSSGLYWQPTIDVFKFNSQFTVCDNASKRRILSEIAQLFDPLGLLSPITVRAKIFLQELWTVISVELHGFSDASNLAMAAAVYLRVTSSESLTTTQLVCAKTKVAPLKRLTIPRLELTAALLLVRLMTHVKRALEFSEIPVFLWTDSSVTLMWISLHPSRWKDFVRNRVTLIQELSSAQSWRFVSDKENPADCASKGLRADQLTQHSLVERTCMAVWSCFKLAINP
ncbi:uncharacterized protein LOC116844967 [Odontomachus brunneus]|uniref:uncharacterized protein LOC116844967 n=1 Tax=Odontomachus brunneus TaxID=486640 RepID=UPI0013F1A97E|nr:uncharacterized protein LOC116844967 [Odontomachus brunneus]